MVSKRTNYTIIHFQVLPEVLKGCVHLVEEVRVMMKVALASLFSRSNETIAARNIVLQSEGLLNG